MSATPYECSPLSSEVQHTVESSSLKKEAMQEHRRQQKKRMEDLGVDKQSASNVNESEDNDKSHGVWASGIQQAKS